MSIKNPKPGDTWQIKDEMGITGYVVYAPDLNSPQHNNWYSQVMCRYGFECQPRKWFTSYDLAKRSLSMEGKFSFAFNLLEVMAKRSLARKAANLAVRKDWDHLIRAEKKKIKQNLRMTVSETGKVKANVKFVFPKYRKKKVSNGPI